MELTKDFDIREWRVIPQQPVTGNSFVDAIRGKPGHYCTLYRHIVKEVTVRIKIQYMARLNKWGRDNFTGEFQFDNLDPNFIFPIRVWIENEQDAALFLLKWG